MISRIKKIVIYLVIATLLPLFLIKNTGNGASLLSIFSDPAAESYSLLSSETALVIVQAGMDTDILTHSSSSDITQALPDKKLTRKKYYPMPKRLAMRGIEQDGIGYCDGYATLEGLFGPVDLPQKVTPLLDVRGHHLYNDTYAANLGLIFRNFDALPQGQILGGNVYCDYRQGCLAKYFQLGLGLEILGPIWDLRLNGSMPLNHQNHTRRCIYDGYEDGYIATFTSREFSYTTYNLEGGVYLVNTRNWIIYCAGGPYYLAAAKHSNALGGKARLKLQYNDYLSLEVSASRDGIFHNIFQGEITLSLPLYQMGKNAKKATLFDRRLYQPVQRFEIIPLHKNCGWEMNF